MKKSGKSILYLTIFVLIIVVLILIGIIINLLNKNKIEENKKIAKEQLEETTTNNAYITLEAHNLELKDKQQEINNIQNTAGQATATADKILKDYTAYKDGQLITGTMINRGELNWSPSTSTSYTVPAGYYSGGTISTANAYNAASGQMTCLGAVQGSWNAGTTSGSKSYTIPEDGKYIFLIFNSAYKHTTANASVTLNGTALSLTYLVGQIPLYDGGYIYRTDLISCKKGDVIKSIFNNENNSEWKAFTTIIIFKA